MKNCISPDYDFCLTILRARIHSAFLIVRKITIAHRKEGFKSKGPIQRSDGKDLFDGFAKCSSYVAINLSIKGIALSGESV